MKHSPQKPPKAPATELAWHFWKAQHQLVKLNLRLAHLKNHLKKHPAKPNYDDKGDFAEHSKHGTAAQPRSPAPKDAEK